MAITDFFTCFRVALKCLCVAFLLSTTWHYNKNNPTTTMAKGRNEGIKEREKTDPTGFNHPFCLNI